MIVVFNMKKIIFLIAALVYNLAALGQQVALNSGISVDIPNGAQKIPTQAPN